MIVSVVCLGFKIDVSPQSQRILLNETAVFNLTLKHAYPDAEVFELYSTDVFWNIRTEYPLRVPGHDVFKTKIFIRPLNINPGIYGIPLIFKQTSIGEKEEARVVVELGSPFSVSDYLPAVMGTPELKKEVDPKKPYDIALTLQNKNKRDLSVVEIKVRSNLINKDYVTDLGPLKQKKVKFTVNLDPYIAPQNDTVFITVLVPEKDKVYQFDLFPSPIQVISYGYIDENISVSESFLKTTSNIRITNNGNGIKYYKYSVDAGFFKRLFISSTPEMKSKNGKLEWNIPLKPKQSMDIVLVENYRSLFWLIVLIFAVILCYFVFRSPIVIKKSARVIRSRDGGSDIKIVIEVVNRGFRKVRNFEMIDLVPKIAELVQETPATIEPDSITKSEHKGILIKWKIKSLDPKEQRIISYAIRSKLNILGGIKLPVAVAKFKSEYREREVTSNPVFVKLDQKVI